MALYANGQSIRSQWQEGVPLRQGTNLPRCYTVPVLKTYTASSSWRLAPTDHICETAVLSALSEASRLH